MGVKGLQYYIEQHCPDACKYVSIEQLAQQHRLQFNSQPIIAVDGSSIVRPVYSKSLEWVYGGQWLQYFHELESFIKRFNTAGIRLVFFFDGTVCSSKMEEWVKRRVNNYKQVSSVFWNVKTLHTEPDKKFFVLPFSMCSLTKVALKELGAEVYQTVRECDEEIACYATRNRDVFAILSQDTDFLIYNTKVYLSITHLDLNTLVTIHYDRNCLAFSYLHLHVNQLPLFACLVGNDIVSKDKLKYFHRRMSEQQGRTSIIDIIRNIVALIIHERWIGDFNNRLELDSISLKVFGNLNGSPLIYESLKSYSCAFNLPPSPRLNFPLPSHIEKAVFERHVCCANGQFLFNIFCNLEYKTSEVLEDPTSFPSSLIYRKIRQRCYTVLLNSGLHNQRNYDRSFKNIVIKEWCAYQGNYLEKPDLIEPLPLETYAVGIPTLDQLWFKCTEMEKMKLFWSIIQVPLNFELLFTIPKHLIVLCCVLNYLIACCDNGPEIKPWEVAVCIAQSVLKKTVLELQNLVVPWVEAPAVHLATLILCGISHVQKALEICGHPIDVYLTMPWRYFDGKLFHFLYARSIERRSISKLCKFQEDAIQLFYAMLAVATSNTEYATDKMNWRHILDDFDKSRVK